MTAFPQDRLRDLGFEISDGRLYDVNTGDPYRDRGGAPHLQRDKIIDLVGSYVTSLLSRECQLMRVFVPLDSLTAYLSLTRPMPSDFDRVKHDIQRATESPPRPAHEGIGVEFWMSQGAVERAGRVLVLIQSSGAKASAGMWGIETCLKLGLNTGTILPYVEAARRGGLAICLLRPCPVDGQGRRVEIPFEDEVVRTTWRALFAIMKSTQIYVLAYLYGGEAFVSLLEAAAEDEWLSRVRSVVFCDPKHDFRDKDAPGSLREFMQRCMAMCPTHLPRMTPLTEHARRFGCLTVAGNINGESMMTEAIDDIFHSFEQARPREATPTSVPPLAFPGSPSRRAASSAELTDTPNVKPRKRPPSMVRVSSKGSDDQPPKRLVPINLSHRNSTGTLNLRTPRMRKDDRGLFATPVVAKTGQMSPRLSATAGKERHIYVSVATPGHHTAMRCKERTHRIEGIAAEIDARKQLSFLEKISKVAPPIEGPLASARSPQSPRLETHSALVKKKPPVPVPPLSLHALSPAPGTNAAIPLRTQAGVGRGRNGALMTNRDKSRRPFSPALDVSVVRPSARGPLKRAADEEPQPNGRPHYTRVGGGFTDKLAAASPRGSVMLKRQLELLRKAQSQRVIIRDDKKESLSRGGSTVVEMAAQTDTDEDNGSRAAPEVSPRPRMADCEVQCLMKDADKDLRMLRRCCSYLLPLQAVLEEEGNGAVANHPTTRPETIDEPPMSPPAKQIQPTHIESPSADVSPNAIAPAQVPSSHEPQFFSALPPSSRRIMMASSSIQELPSAQVVNAPTVWGATSDASPRGRPPMHWDGGSPKDSLVFTPRDPQQQQQHQPFQIPPLQHMIHRASATQLMQVVSNNLKDEPVNRPRAAPAPVAKVPPACSWRPYAAAGPAYRLPLHPAMMPYRHHHPHQRWQIRPSASMEVLPPSMAFRPMPGA
ncbi:unnamed protein product [Vitrella brassicaformis CCMP3155]|uniref:Arb2 domain-containing protein n=1 Tax=Vitrella brassicaformis (strain CCMP3155) TaxID=1169540 RepID=A0A0G4GBM7_VITBC|nr:unnamed protein product [Vitrella brassicaformis CCMP3155]|eukprot:CEM26493.1 unnamed protein product [Vitrella brassicaformis CCMP3155]